MLKLTVHVGVRKKVYVWKKGDTLEKVAKANGQRNGDEIWKDPDNRDVVKKRGKPESLAPGDKIVVADLADMAKALKKTIEGLQASVTAQQAKTAHYDNLIKGDQKVTDALVSEAEADLKKFEKASNRAEIIELGTGLGKALLKIGTAGLKAASGSAKALEAAHEQAVEGVKELYKEPAHYAAAKIADKHLESESKVVAVLSRTVTVAGNLLSPYWFGTALARLANGKDPLTVLATTLGDDIKEEIKQTKKEGQARVALYQASKQESAATLACLKAQLKAAQDDLRQVSR